MLEKSIIVDLSGPQGNAFWLIGYAKKLAKQLDLDGDALAAEMMEGDYEALLAVFEREFGEYVELRR